MRTEGSSNKSLESSLKTTPSNARRVLPRKVVLFVFAAFITLSLTSLPRYFSEIHSANWPTTTGVISVSQLRQSELRVMGAYGVPGYLPDVHYTYNVGGMKFEGAHIDFHIHQRLHSKEFAERWLKAYPTGMVVTVYYNPRNSNIAVLVPGIQREQRDLFFFALGSIIFFAMVFTLVFLYYGKTFPIKKAEAKI